MEAWMKRLGEIMTNVTDEIGRSYEEAFEA